MIEFTNNNFDYELNIFGYISVRFLFNGKYEEDDEYIKINFGEVYEFKTICDTFDSLDNISVLVDYEELDSNCLKEDFISLVIEILNEDCRFMKKIIDNLEDYLESEDEEWIS